MQNQTLERNSLDKSERMKNSDNPLRRGHPCDGSWCPPFIPFLHIQKEHGESISLGNSDLGNQSAHWPKVTKAWTWKRHSFSATQPWHWLAPKRNLWRYPCFQRSLQGKRRIRLRVPIRSLTGKAFSRNDGEKNNRTASSLREDFIHDTVQSS